MHGFLTLAFILILMAPTLRAQSVTDPSDVISVDAIVSALYDVISGPADEARDWDRFRALFHPAGRMVPMQPRPGETWEPVRMTPDEFAQRNAELMRTHPLFEGKGFYETEAARRTEQFGNIATVWSTYEGRLAPDDKTPFLRGINALDLVHDGKRWWVLQILWQPETSQLPLPVEYLSAED